MDSDDAFENIIGSVWHYSKEDEKEENRLLKQLSKVDQLVNEGRVAGARTKIGMEDPGANFYARRHNSSMMSDALGVDLCPHLIPKDTATLHRKQLLARTHASSQVAKAMAIGDQVTLKKKEIKSHRC